MIYNIEEFLDFLCDKKIDANEYLLCMLLYYNDEGMIEKFKNRFRIFEPERGKYIKSMLENLIALGYVDDFNDVRDGLKYYDVNLLMVTPKFTQEFLIDKEDAAEELWKAYPKRMFIDRMVPARSMDYDEFVKKYNSIIKGNKKLHKKILNILENYKKSHDYPEMGIEKFLGSRHWETLEEEQKGEGPGYGETEI